MVGGPRVSPTENFPPHPEEEERKASSAEQSQRMKTAGKLEAPAPRQSLDLKDQTFELPEDTASVPFHGCAYSSPPPPTFEIRIHLQGPDRRAAG